MGMIQLMLSLLLYCASLSKVNETIVNNIWRICLCFTSALRHFYVLAASGHRNWMSRRCSIALDPASSELAGVSSIDGRFSIH